MEGKFLFIIPVYNDWHCLDRLLSDLGIVFSSFSSRINILVVDDGSLESPGNIKTFAETEILRLRRNVGHQKALAIGLAYANENLQFDKVLIMDADGEDRPTDAFHLVNESTANPERIIIGKRTKRLEGSGFRMFYYLYRIMFRLLTGMNISFGNFMLVPKSIVSRLVHYSEIWHHLPASILKSGFDYVEVNTIKGSRYAGKSRMNFGSLLLHGFGSLAVFIELIAARLLVFSVFLILISLAAIIIILFIRYFTALAIPGWASTMLSSFVILLLQGFLLSLFTVFLFLAGQSQRKFIPALHYTDYTFKP